MKKNLLTGLAILLPLALTLFVLIFLIDLFTNPFMYFIILFINKFFPSLNPHYLPLIARVITLLILFVTICILGLLVRWLFIHSLIQWLQSLLSRIPLVKTIYKVAKDIVHALLSKEGRKAFKHTVLVPFPSKKSYAAGLSSGEVPHEISKKIEIPLEPVFLPTSPHLISGFLIFYPKEKIRSVEMTHQEFVKYIVSCGIIVSEKPKKKKT